jgi:hypothetical protein
MVWFESRGWSVGGQVDRQLPFAHVATLSQRQTDAPVVDGFALKVSKIFVANPITAKVLRVDAYLVKR